MAESKPKKKLRVYPAIRSAAEKKVDRLYGPQGQTLGEKYPYPKLFKKPKQKPKKK